MTPDPLKSALNLSPKEKLKQPPDLIFFKDQASILSLQFFTLPSNILLLRQHAFYSQSSQ
jgi:hypothetical protein